MMAIHSSPEYPPFSSSVEKPLASLVSSLQLLAEDRRPAPYITAMAYASSLTTVFILLALIIAVLYTIIKDYRRHAVMYAFFPHPTPAEQHLSFCFFMHFDVLFVLHISDAGAI